MSTFLFFPSPHTKLDVDGSQTISNLLGDVSGFYRLLLQIRKMEACKGIYLGTTDSEWIHCNGVLFSDSLGV